MQYEKFTNALKHTNVMLKMNHNCYHTASVQLIFLLLFLLSTAPIFAQQYQIRGKIFDEQGNEVTNVKVSVNGGAFLSPIPKKGFMIYLDKGKKPESVKVSKGRQIKDWNYSEKKQEITILLTASAQRLTGKVMDHTNRPMNGAKVQIHGVNASAHTNSSGSFQIFLPPDRKINPSSVITVNDSIPIPRENLTIRDDGFYVSIKVPKTQSQNTITESITYRIRLQDPQDTPLPNTKLIVNGNEYVTDHKGWFELTLTKEQILAECEFFLLDYAIVKLNFKDQQNYFIQVKKVNQIDAIEAQEEVSSIYQEDFNRIINELEFEKQLLSQKGSKIRDEIQQITNKLNLQDIQESQKSMLENDLNRLMDALVATDKAYEDAQAKTQKVVAEMQQVIMQKDSLTDVVNETIEDLEEQRSIGKIELAIVIILSLSLITAFILIRKTKKEKKIIQRSHARISQINTIGQKVSATLNIDTLVQTVHENVHQLLDASVFGVGIYDVQEGKIIFKNFIDSGQIIPYMEEDITDETKFSVYCIKTSQPVVINDLATEATRYLSVDEYPVSPDWPKALIYLPLISNDKAIGVITVQSFKKNAYAQIEQTLLQTLSSFVTIALKNGKAYREIENKNKNITASIRYAKTIQQAILPNENTLASGLDEYFTIYKPKDIVSGDFYWFLHQPKERLKFIAAVDCTGHGVPGAFMSMVGNSLLDKIVNIDKIYDTAQILEHLNVRVREVLKQDEKANDDGMDVCLCVIQEISLEEYTLMFTGAKRPLYYIPRSTAKLVTLKGDSKSIGGRSLKKKPFTNQEIRMSKGDTIYLTSDGLADQSDTEKNKFGTLRLSNLLETNAYLPMQAQKNIIETELRNHQNDAEQRDDIMIIGVRI